MEKHEIKDNVTESYGAISLGKIVIDKNIRINIDDENINNLAESMKEYGQLQQIRVYEKVDKYVVIYGHRRFLAAKKAGLSNIKVVIVSEPKEIDKIYLQAIENEQSKSLPPEDRETYIHLLLEKGESFNKISKAIGISESWVRECACAYIVRKKYQALLSDAGIDFSTKELYALRNATDDQVKEAIEFAKENPENKKDIFENLGKLTKKKMNVGGKKKVKDNSISGRLRILFDINIDEDKKLVSIHTKKDVKIEEILEKLLIENIKNYYEKKGYVLYI